MKDLRAIAFYLPQFHPIPENDIWWGKGFTEWTNVAKARPLFPGHKQPHLPADLGFYDLRVPEVRELQAAMARHAGIEGFCYWHYWFGNGKRLLERPFNEVLASGRPDFPFCLAWANESWSGIWHGAGDKLLMKQDYPGRKDYEDHFFSLLPAFNDKRYIRVDNKPIFVIYNPTAIPDLNVFCEVFRDLAIRNGLEGLFLVANNYKNTAFDWNPVDYGFDACTISAHSRVMHEKNSWNTPHKKYAPPVIFNRILKKFGIQRQALPDLLYDYSEAARYFIVENTFPIDLIPTAITGWDNSPRCGTRGLILKGYTPETFRTHLKEVFKTSEKSRNRLVFVKSWNEWAEGNYLEPESEYGMKFLEVFREEIGKYNC